jgi:hypothetical protein
MWGSADLSFGMIRRGRGREVMGGEGESGRLKKKGRHIGPRWAVSSSWAGVQSYDGNETKRK